MKLQSNRWTVVGKNPDGSAFVVKCYDEQQARVLAKEIKGKVVAPKKAGRK